ncbi:MAG: RGCVC family protein [Pseudonocardiaceae bacterium]
MATIDVAPKTPDDTTDMDTAAEETCLVCAHPWGTHDVISTRFCTATIAGALTRGCACPPARL